MKNSVNEFRHKLSVCVAIVFALVASKAFTRSILLSIYSEHSEFDKANDEAWNGGIM